MVRKLIVPSNEALAALPSSPTSTHSGAASQDDTVEAAALQISDLVAELSVDGPVELICIPGFGGSRLKKPDENGVDVEIYPALWQCIKGLGKPSERMIRQDGDGSYASDVLTKIAHIRSWVPIVELKKSLEVHMWAYDWRRDVDELGPLFLAWLLGVKAQRPEGTRFVIIAHSYGGLVTIDALSKLEDPHLIRGVITLGSPFQGTYNVHQVRRDGFKIFRWLEVYTPATYQSFASLWLMTPKSKELRAWRRKIENLNDHILRSTPFVCISGSADTLNTEIDDILKMSEPSSRALGDGTVTVESATSPPGVEIISKVTSSKSHILLGNCEESIAAALDVLSRGL